MIRLESTTDGVILPVRAQPGARRNAIVGVHDGALKVAVTQAPEKGKANEAIVEVLCASLALRKSQIELLSGARASHKRFRVAEIDLDALRVRIDDILPR